MGDYKSMKSAKHKMMLHYDNGQYRNGQGEFVTIPYARHELKHGNANIRFPNGRIVNTLAELDEELDAEVEKFKPAVKMKKDDLKELVKELANELEQAVKIIKEHVPIEALGIDTDTPGAEPGQPYREWPVLDEHLHYMNKALEKAKAFNG